MIYVVATLTIKPEMHAEFIAAATACIKETRKEPGNIAYDLERFQAKWIPVRVKKTRQNKKIEPRSNFIGTKKALGSGHFKPKGPGGFRDLCRCNAEREA